MERRRVIYYRDEQNDEFSRAQIEPKKIDSSFLYCRDGFFGKLCHLFFYRIIATPIAFLYTKLKFRHRIVGKGILKPYKKTPYFIYGNHTQDIADAFIPNMLSFPQRSFMIVHPNNVSMPVLGKITPYLGAIPLPDDIGAYRNFIRAIEKRITQGSAVVIYPEAHIWPYYTGIRNFPDTSFDYPVKFGVPCFCFTNTYHKRLFGVKIETYIDGPFFPDTSLPKREQKSELRNRVYGTMCERAKKSDFELIKYIKQVENTEDPDTESAKGEKEK